MAANDSLLVPCAVSSTGTAKVLLARKIYVGGSVSVPIIPDHAGQYCFVGGDAGNADSAFDAFRAETGIDFNDALMARTYGYISEAAYTINYIEGRTFVAVYALLTDAGLTALGGAINVAITNGSVPGSVLSDAMVVAAASADAQLGARRLSGDQVAGLIKTDVVGGNRLSIISLGWLVDEVQERANVTAGRYRYALASLGDALDAIVNPVLAVRAPKIVFAGQANLPVTIDASARFTGNGHLTCSHGTQVALIAPDGRVRAWPADIANNEFGRAFALRAAGISANVGQIALTLRLLGGGTLTGSPVTDRATAGTLKMQVREPRGWVDVGVGRIYVHSGVAVDFRVVAAPVDTPLGVIAWTGPAGAAGSNATATITFNVNSANRNDVKAVTVTCLGVTLRASVVVYQLTGTLTPNDNFLGRSTTRYGLYELVSLNTTVEPADLSVTALGGAQWKRVSGASTLTARRGDGMGTLRAHYAAENLRLRLEILSGPCAGLGVNYDRAIVAPDDGVIVQQPHSRVGHTYNTASVRIWGWIYMGPTDVSFREIYFREGTVRSVATGSYRAVGENNRIHALGPTLSILNGNRAAGSAVSTYDDISTGEVNPVDFGIGEFTWPIPWQYMVPIVGTWNTFTIATHHQTMRANGTTMLEKARSGQFVKAAADPSVSRGPADWPTN